MQALWNKLPRQNLAIIAGYFLVAMLIVGHTPRALLTSFIGNPSGDIHEMARNAWWFTYAIKHGEPLFTQTLLGYPDGIDGTLFMTVPLQYFPIWGLAFFLPLHVAYNITILLWMALNGWALYWLMRYLLADEHVIPALIAGVIYMAFPLFQGHLSDGHGGLMVAWPAPLYIWSIFRLVSTKTRIRYWMGMSILFFYLTTTGHILQSVYVLLPITAALTLSRLKRRKWNHVLRLVFMGAVASILLMMILFPAINNAANESAYTQAQGFVRYSSDSLNLFTPSFFHPFFENLDYAHEILGENTGEGMAYIGVIVGLLVLIGLIKKRVTRWWFILGIAAWVLSLGPILKFLNEPVKITLDGEVTFIPLPFAYLETLSGFGLARTPARFTFTLAIVIAVIAGYGLAVLWESPLLRDRRRRYLFGLLITGLILFEYQSFWPQPLAPAEIPQAVYDLREIDDVRAVFNVPYQHVLTAKDALYLQTAHEYPLIGGQITRQTPVNPAKLAILQGTFDGKLLSEAGADIVIFHRSRAQSIGQFEPVWILIRQKLGDPIYEDDRIMIYAVPEQDALLEIHIALPTQGTTENTIPYPIFVPESGWIDLTGTLQADGRDVILSLDGEPIQRWHVEGEMTIQTPVFLSERGYYNLELALDPPCPIRHDDTLQCNALTYDMQSQFTAAPFIFPTQYEDGIQLVRGSLNRAETLDIRLQWAFTNQRKTSDRRFVHVLDANGNIVLQQDVEPPVVTHAIGWSDFVQFSLDDLPDGTYTVQTGWYNLDTQTNYRVDEEAAHVLGTFQVGD